jgi:hypothetical protein
MIGKFLAYVMAAVAQDGVASAIVPDAHRHEWIKVAHSSGVPTFLDVAYRGTGNVDGKAYPVVLVRYLRGEPIEKAMIVDVRIAIDCDANAMSGIEVGRTSPAQGGTGMRISKKEALSTPFRPVYPQNEARIEPLFKHACGPDWSMKALG